MKHIVTSSQAAVFMEVLRKIEAAQQRSPAMMAAIDIDQHDLGKCKALLQNLEHPRFLSKEKFYSK